MDVSTFNSNRKYQKFEKRSEIKLMRGAMRVNLDIE
jgi:hypothetical protein